MIYSWQYNPLDNHISSICPPRLKFELELNNPGSSRPVSHARSGYSTDQIIQAQCTTVFTLSLMPSSPISLERSEVFLLIDFQGVLVVRFCPCFTNIQSIWLLGLLGRMSTIGSSTGTWIDISVAGSSCTPGTGSVTDGPWTSDSSIALGEMVGFIMGVECLNGSSRMVQFFSRIFCFVLSFFQIHEF